uniref:Plastid-encoded RNA polymerase subunit alpha n=1 Tax=Rhipiliopsis peltata TaxID=2320810 RepID=A0A386B188_9CHLO|nr:RNA polymerase a-subunit [Rhipiliopsis peltata]AYC65462.1 RNA polymerase a-subunit [Rhipiliopsis peltata]
MNQQKNFYCISSRIEKTGQFYGCFKIGPFLGHQGLTFANALRRTLLADQSRCIFDAVQIYGIEHEFSNLLGIRESVVDILLNLEKLIFQIQKPITKPKVAFVAFAGPGILRAQHLHLPPGFKCIDPSQYIATLEVDGQLTLKLFFSPNWEKFQYLLQKTGKSTNIDMDSHSHHSAVRIFQPQQQPLQDILFLKSSLCTIEKVNYTLQLSSKDEEFILFEVWTDGSLHPKAAISKAINELLLDIFLGFTVPIENLEQSLWEFIPQNSNSRNLAQLQRFSKVNFREKFLSLDIGNFSFDIQTFLFFKKNKIYRIIDLLSFFQHTQLQPNLDQFRVFIFSLMKIQ